MIKNAIAYITRKRNRTLIIFIILTIVFSCLYSCLTIMKSSNEIEKALYESSNSSISITKKDGEYFNVNQFKDIEKLKEVEEIIIQYDGLAKLKDAKVVSGEQIINREDLSDEFKNVVSFEATNNTKRNILFSSRVFTIKEGKNIGENDKNSIIVHEEFAKKNNLKLGDEVNLELLDIEKSGRIKSHKFKIIGIFSGKKQETYTGLSSDFSENMMFVDYSTSQEILNKSENNKIANKILMYSGSAESTDLALNKLKELKIDESKYFVEKDSNAFEESLESVSGIKHIIKIMTYSIMLGGIIVLSLILILWLRERIYEIGIFLSIGTSKIQIIMQFIFELLFISIPSIIASLFLGNVLLRVIAGGFINSDNSMISGGNLINNSSFILNITTLGQSYLILISIIVLSVVFAAVLRGELAEQQSIFVMRTFREMRHYISQNQQFVTRNEMELLTAKVGTITERQDRMEKKVDSIQKDVTILADNFITDKDKKNFVIYKGQKLEADIAYIEIYQQAKKSIYVVDDYMNAKSLQHLSQKADGVEVVLFTENGKGGRGFLTNSLVTDFQNEYPTIRIKSNPDCHDRLIVLDYGEETERVYHCGASSKDAGKKLCAINQITETAIIHPVIDRLLSLPDKKI